MFAAYVRKTARLRDKADSLIREIGTYGDTETPNLKRGMKEFADHLAKIEDYRQAEVKLQCIVLIFLLIIISYWQQQPKVVGWELWHKLFALQVERLEAKVIEPLKSYGAVVKRKRVSVKTGMKNNNNNKKHLTETDYEV